MNMRRSLTAIELPELDRDALLERLVRAHGELGATEFRGLVEDAEATAEGRWAIDMTDRLRVIDKARWQGDPPTRQYLWGEMLPEGNVTMLTGRGGIGKSLFAQGLLASVAAGLPYLGLDTAPAPCLYVTCEDDETELWRRMVAFCDQHALRLPMLDKLHLVSLCGDTDTALATFDPGTGRVIPTTRWRQLCGTIIEHGIRLVALDNATDFMAGDLNDLHQVAEFVNMLQGLSKLGCTAMILHHPNKAGEDWLGSVAWHNKVRSRLIIEDGGADGDPDVRAIRNPKANYSASGTSVTFRWHEGTFIADADLSAEKRGQLESTARAAADNLLFLACLATMTKQERAVSHAPSNTYAPKAFEGLVESKGIGKKRLEAAMNRLLALGHIEKGELPWKKSDRHQAIGLRLTSAGDVECAGDAAVNAAGDVRETCGQRAVDSAVDAAETHSPYYVREGAAPIEGQAAPSNPSDVPESLPGDWD